MFTELVSRPHKPPSLDYDLVSSIQDEIPTENSGIAVAVAIFTSSIIISFVGGFSLHMAFNKTKYKKALQVSSRELEVLKEEIENPARFARRALGWGTFYAFLGTGTVGLTGACIWKL